MDWELTKENCVPVRQGRSKAALHEITTQDPTQDALEAKRRELWAEVTDYKGDDPLEAWTRYIKWMQEYGVGGGKADLMKVLEACTKELQKYPRYTNDIRFLRIWIQYADCLPDPDDVFLFLKEKGIGRDFALYYEAYATYFELKGNFQGADAVYMDGIQRGVKQLERLKQKHYAFQQRMAQRVQRRIQDEQVMGPPPAEPVRGTLATIGSRAAGRGHLGQQQSSAGIFGVAAAPQQQAPGLFGMRPGPAQQPRALKPVGLQEDEEFAGGENPRFGLPGYSSMPQVNSSRELQPFAVRRKENLDRALAWNQSALLPGTAPATTGPSGGGIDIFTDEEFQEDELPGRAAGQPQRSGAPPAAGQSLLLPGADRSAGAGVDSLVFSLAPPPRMLLRGGLPPGPTHSVSESIAALSVSGPGAALTQQPHVPPLLSVPAAAVEGSLTRQPDGAASSRAALTSRPGVSLGTVGAEGPPASATAAEAAVGSSSGEGEEEMSYEELRAAAWSRRNPAPRLQASSTAEAAGVSSGSGAQMIPTEPRRAALSSRPLAPQSVDSVVLRSAGGSEGPGSVSTSGRQEAPLTAASVRRAPFGQVLPGGTSTADPENGPAAAGGIQPRRTLGDAAPGAHMPLGQAAGPSLPAAQPGSRIEPQPAAAPAPFGQVLPALAQQLPSGSVMADLENGPAVAGGLQQRRVLGGAAPGARITLGQAAGPAGPSFPAARPLGSRAEPPPDAPPAPFGQALPATAQQLSSGSFTADPENGPAAAGGIEPHRVLGDTAPGARMPLGLAAGAGCPSFLAAQALGPQVEPPPPAAALPSAALARDRDRRHDDAQPTVTISTRGAFDLINSLFSEDLPHQQARASSGLFQPSSSLAEPAMMAAPPPPQPEAARPSRSQPQAAYQTLVSAAAPPPPPSEAARSSWSQQQTAQPTSTSARPHSSAAEPTVTLHTKLAFDALNDMFCDTLPHEEARKIARRAASSGGHTAGLGHMPISNADVCRLANAGRSSVAAAPGAGRRDPLCGIGGGGCGGVFSVAAEPTLPTVQGLAVGSSSLAIHEDTFFMGPGSATLPGDPFRGSGGGDAGRLGPSSGLGPNSAPHMGGGLYEDTEFMPRGGGMSGSGGGGTAAASSGAFIMEDTEFMTRHQGSHMAAPPMGGYDRTARTLGGRGLVASGAQTTAGRQGARDSYVPRLSGRGVATDVQQRYAQAKGPLQVYEDTQYGLGD